MTEQERMDAGKKVVARLGRLCEEKYDRTLDDEEKMALQMGLFYARDDEFNKGRVDVLCPGNLNVKALLDCDDFSLAHDVFQIDQYICKDSGQRTFGTMTRCFVPRCGFEKAEHKRENRTGEESSAVGNAAAMRKALEQFVEYSNLVCKMGMFNRDRLVSITKKACDAISVPARNCDVGTAEEQDARHSKWCRKYGIDGDMEVACAHQDMSCTLCALRWAQMPYEEGDAK